MPRWTWFLPLGALVLALAVWAFRLGWIAATLTETDVIKTWSARYLVEDPDTRRLSDCTARPGRMSQVWIIVSCIDRAGMRHDYPVDRWGRLLEISPAQAEPAAPRT